MKNKEFSNKLIHETSPYLLQHAHNPVDWYPWGEEALRRAKVEDKPIFLSIGYSACHWCHVMEHESFEDPETAKIMNTHFINIKVDREERPDLDHIYMSAVQLMTHHGGWPMSVFLTPQLEPFYGGTYFPPVDRSGMPAFSRILLGVAGTWKSKRSEVTRSASDLLTALKQLAEPEPASTDTLSWQALTEGAYYRIKKSFDPVYGGLGQAPKFFHTMDIRVALRHWKNTGDAEALNIVTHTLEQWKRGGIYDQLGGGFHRYSTDQEWLVPHFEKMLYDNALLVQVYLEAYQATQNLEFAKTARETLDFIAREMTSPDGVFYSTQDADSEGVEGKFYVWEEAEIRLHLDKEIASVFILSFNVTSHGNWEHSNILNRTRSWKDLAASFNCSETELEEALAVAKRKLLSIRQQRVAPDRDDKVLVSWNGLMIESFAFAYQVLGEDHYLQMAQKAASFLLDHVWDAQVLQHSYTKGIARFNGYLDDYANFINALLTLYESDFQEKWLDAANAIAVRMLDQFGDEKQKTFFYTAKNHETLILRPTEVHDGATPSSTSMAITALVRLGKLGGNTSLLRRAESALLNQENLMRTLPNGAGQMLIALELLLNRSKEIVILPGSPEETESILHYLRGHFIPNKVIALKTNSASLNPMFNGRTALDGKTTVYVCENQSCQLPVTNTQELEKLL